MRLIALEIVNTSHLLPEMVGWNKGKVICGIGEIGKHMALKMPRLMPYRFEFGIPHQKTKLNRL